MRFHLNYFGADAVFNRRAGGGVIAYVSIQYFREAVYGEPITGCAGIARLGNSSYTLAQALFQAEHCVGEATCVIAQRDNGRAESLSESLRERLGALLLPTK